MYARVTTGTCPPAKVGELTKIVRDAILPASKKQKGFKKLILLGGRATGKGMLIVLWNRESEMTVAKSSEWYREHMAKVASLTTGTGSIEEYEVVLQG